ncbi:MAG: FMN-binding protein, partial [Candidatus Eisenbacteria bacterium]|nr:FMN-binding protein [Candidatus Eisenbacteria bacterium]
MSEMTTLAPPEVPTWRMYRAMVGVGLLCGLLIVTAFQVTAPIIARKRAAALQRAVFEVLPGAASSRTFVHQGDGFVPLPEGASDTPAVGEERVYAGFAENGGLIGVAIEAEGMGYADVIKVL